MNVGMRSSLTRQTDGELKSQHVNAVRNCQSDRDQDAAAFHARPRRVSGIGENAKVVAVSREQEQGRM
jgi:hypothetical protein